MIVSNLIQGVLFPLIDKRGYTLQTVFIRIYKGYYYCDRLSGFRHRLLKTTQTLGVRRGAGGASGGALGRRLSV